MAYVIFDTETTGFHPQLGDRIIEIAGVRVINGEVTTETFSSLINPHRLVPAEAVRVHGITDEMLLTAPEANEVIPQFLEFVASDTLVAHNAEFDMAFLKHELELLQMDASRLPNCMCTVELSREKLPELDRHNLDCLCEHFGLSIEQRHRALDDVKATAEIFLKIHDEEPTLF